MCSQPKEEFVPKPISPIVPGWIPSQVESETTKHLARSFKGHSSFTSSVNGWLGCTFSDTFSWLPTWLRAILRSGLQIVLLIVILICSIHFVFKLLMLCITQCWKTMKTQIMVTQRVAMIHQATVSTHPPICVIHGGWNLLLLCCCLSFPSSSCFCERLNLWVY